jgi:hypothetical protein
MALRVILCCWVLMLVRPFLIEIAWIKMIMIWHYQLKAKACGSVKLKEWKETHDSEPPSETP